MKTLVMTLHLRFEDSVATGGMQKEIQQRIANIPGLVSSACAAQPPYMPLMGPGLAGDKTLAVRMSALYPDQARMNHYQDLQRLAERGGISPAEAVALVQGRSFRDIPNTEALMLLYGAKEDISRV